MKSARDPVCDAIAHPVRRAILDALRRQGELTVTEVRGLVPLPAVVASQHLRALRVAGLVEFERVGRRRRYVLTAESLGPLLAWLSGFRRHIREGAAIRRRARERRTRRATAVLKKILDARRTR